MKNPILMTRKYPPKRQLPPWLLVVIGVAAGIAATVLFLWLGPLEVSRSTPEPAPSSEPVSQSSQSVSPELTPEATPEATATPTPTPKATATPKPTATPKATATKKPKPTVDPARRVPLPTTTPSASFTAMKSTKSNGVTLCTFIDRAVEIALAEPVDPVEDGKTKYGELFGNARAAWCTEFVMYCLKQAEKELGTSFIGSAYPWTDSSGGVRYWYKKFGNTRYYGRLSVGYKPTRGDIILFDTVDAGSTDHTGFVVDVTEEDGKVFVYTVEGNVPGRNNPTVEIRRLALDDPTIYAFCSPVDRPALR